MRERWDKLRCRMLYTYLSALSSDGEYRDHCTKDSLPSVIERKLTEIEHVNQSTNPRYYPRLKSRKIRNLRRSAECDIALLGLIDYGKYKEYHQRLIDVLEKQNN